MKNFIPINGRSIILLLGIFMFFYNNAFSFSEKDTSINKIFQEVEVELVEVYTSFNAKINSLNNELKITNQFINKLDKDDTKSLILKVNALIKLNQIKDNIERAEKEHSVEMFKIRYRKGLELIKIIYEKVLGLDHHFTSLQIFQNVATLSNPNSFPEFSDAKNILKSRLEKKQAIRLPSLFESNPFVSLTYSLASSLFGGGSRGQREKNLEQVACILDFTVKMSNDLKTIYYETEFLKENNQMLKEECIKLFKDYVKVIGYKTSLSECRKEDDWEAVYEMLDNYVSKMEENAKNQEHANKFYQQQVNIVFATDRLMQFMDKYSTFISSGEKYYQKFQTILNNYDNEDICQSQLPRQFSELKKDIELSILKFNEAYNISELQGSKLKDLMYGIQE